MQNKTYIIYLETLVVSLLNERNEDDRVIKNSDLEAPPFAKGFYFSPYNVRAEIKEKRDERP